MPKLFDHQRTIADFILEHHRALVFADPGTGKTAAVLTAIKESGKRAVVFCPKSIMVPAWVRDCQTFTPELSITTAVAPSSKRSAAFKSGADIVVINHDGASWLEANHQYCDGFDFLALDESTAFKNKDAARSKAVRSIASYFDYRVAMTGTPIANDLLDIWHQTLLIDDGEHLGSRYYAFRSATHDPEPVTIDINKWVPKPGALEIVMDLISPICLRYSLEECIDMPPHTLSHRLVDLSPKLRAHYDKMRDDALLAIEEGEVVEGVHAAAQLTKLQQIASGAVYGQEKAYELAAERYDLVAELVAQRRDPCLIGFTWKHQRDGIIRALEKAGIDNYAVLDGEHNHNTADLVDRFQRGEYRALLAHPQTAGHGLTLTRAKTTIWASPIYNAELFEQLNRRIYRTGQKDRTETIVVGAADTVDEQVIAKLTGKIDRQQTALDLLKALSPVA